MAETYVNLDACLFFTSDGGKTLAGFLFVKYAVLRPMQTLFFLYVRDLSSDTRGGGAY